jgi:hypothetical protein
MKKLIIYTQTIGKSAPRYKKLYTFLREKSKNWWKKKIISKNKIAKGWFGWYWNEKKIWRNTDFFYTSYLIF